MAAETLTIPAPSWAPRQEKAGITEPVVEQLELPPGTECGNYGERLVVQVVDELARRTPDRVWASVSRSPYSLDKGFRDITMLQLSNAVNHVAWMIDAHWGRSSSFDVLAYLGTSDVRYGIYTLAAIKCGYQVMVPSMRNAVSQHEYVFDEANCNRVCYTPNVLPTIQALQERLPHLERFVVPTLDELLRATAKPYPYNKTFEEAKNDPIIVAHSSGSTGNPKRTVLMNIAFACYDSHRKLKGPEGRRVQCFGLYALGGDRFFNPYPPFHMSGLYAMCLMPIFYDCAVAMGPEEKPPTAEILSEAMRQITIKAAWCPPSVLEDLIELPGGMEQAATFDWVMYTGGPLAASAGEKLSKVTDVCQLYGSTETGPHIALVPLKENWKWFEWLIQPTFEDQGDGTFEMLVHKNPELDWVRHFSHSYPNIDVWHTSDLFVQAPHNPNLWRFVGRKDDVIVLSNGEKFNPIDMELTIASHPLVKGALIVGTARFQAALIIEPADDVELGAEELLDKLWPTIELANTKGPGHGRIFRHKATVAPKGKEFLRAAKGTVIRGRTAKLFAEEVDRLYSEEHEEKTSKIPSLESPDRPEAVADFVRACVSQLMPLASIADDEDLYTLGMDSLQTLELIRYLHRGFPAHISRNSLKPAAIYAHPTISQLSSHLCTLLHGDGSDSGDDAALDRTQQMEQMLEKYAAQLTPFRSRPPRVVAITGTTGSLGMRLLAVTLANYATAKVYCLNRNPNAKDLTSKALPQYSDVLATKTEFLTVSLGTPNLGLDAATYNTLRSEVDTIIHNAWKVDFNHQLNSFEKDHIGGVANLIHLCLSAPQQPHLAFVSSLSSVSGWDASRGAVPEVTMTDFSAAVAMGYGESKHVAERLIDGASGLRSSILRVGQIAGPVDDLDSGEWHRTEWFPVLVKTSKALGFLPNSMANIDWVPIDRLTNIIDEIVRAEYASGESRIFHLVNPHHATWADLAPAIQGYWGNDKPLKLVPFAEWVSLLRRLENPDPEVYPALKLLEFFEGYAADAERAPGQRVSYTTGNGESASKTMEALQAVDAPAVEGWLKQWGF